MSKARITFVAPESPEAVAGCLAADGWTFGPDTPRDEPGLVRFLSERSGTSVTARFDGTFPRMAVDAASACLVRADADFVAVVAGGIDPAMDAPAPAWVDVGPSRQSDARSLRLPSGFRNPAVDVRTLVAAGMPASEAEACIAAVTGGLPMAAMPAMAAAARV